MGKSISWKQAFIIVIGLHLFGYVAISQYSSYRKQVSKELKEAKNKLYTGSLDAINYCKNNWPKSTTEPKITKVSKPSPTPQITKPVIPKSEKKITTNLIKPVKPKQSSFRISIEPSKIVRTVLPGNSNGMIKQIPVERAQPIQSSLTTITRSKNGDTIYEVEKIIRNIETRIIIN